MSNVTKMRAASVCDRGRLGTAGSLAGGAGGNAFADNSDSSAGTAAGHAEALIEAREVFGINGHGAV